MSLWNKKPVWDVNLRFPNLLLILVIINSILIFKEFILGASANRTKTRSSSGKKLNGLNKLRTVLSKSDEINDNLLEKTFEKLVNLSEIESMAFFVEENSGFKLIKSAGKIPTVLPNLKFFIDGANLRIKYPGNLGEEPIGSIKASKGFISYSSAITRFDALVIPLTFQNGSNGLWVIPGITSPRSVKISLSSTALHLETLYCLINMGNAEGDGRYKDKTTGLLKYDCFADAFDTEIERSERYQQDMSLLSIDLTDFHEYSLEQCKMLKKALSQSLKLSLRRLDLMFCGGRESEFLAILTETNQEVAEIVAGRITKTFAKQIQKFDFIKEEKQLLHIGGATYPTDATHGDGLLEKSQEALKAASEKNIAYASYDKISEILNSWTNGDNE